MMMTTCTSTTQNECISMTVLGGDDRVQPVRSGSLRKMRDRPRRQRQNSRKAETCLFLNLDDEDDVPVKPADQPKDTTACPQNSFIPSYNNNDDDEAEIHKSSPTQSLCKAYSQPAVKQLQAELRHIVERTLKDPANDAAQNALERKHQEMETLVERQTKDDARIHYGRTLMFRRPFQHSRRVRTVGSVPLGESF